MPRTAEARLGRKEVTSVRNPQSEANNYYSIHSDVVNIYTDEDSVHAARGEKRYLSAQGAKADMDLATFRTREQAVRMLHQVMPGNAVYADVQKMFSDKLIIVQKETDGQKWYSVTVADMPADEAHRLCKSIKSSGKDCLVRQ